MISGAFPYKKKHQQVFDLEMAYVEVGSGDPIVFLHGNPSSSYLWRNIIPYAQEYGRCIVPDLIGMGDSDKLPVSGPDSYSFVEHRKYLDELLNKLGIHKNITFVVQDWGSALGFDWARRHPDAVDGIVYTEAIIKPISWNEMPEQAREIFQALQSPEGEKMILEQNSFLNFNLPVNILRELTEEEMAEYHRPFIEPGEGRRPMLSWARQLSDSAEVNEIVTAYGNWLAQSPIPKLFLHTQHGRAIQSHLDFCRSWPEQTEITVPGRHYPMEDAPDEVGKALASWLKRLK